jgi:hypothetical protein
MSKLSDSIARSFPALLRAVGDEISYQTAGGAADPVTLSGIWTDDPLSVWVRESDMAPYRLAKGDVITRGSMSYRVIDPLPLPIMGGLTISLRFARHAQDS